MEPRIRNKYSPATRYSNHRYESLLLSDQQDKLLRRSLSRPKSRMDTEESSASKYLQMMETFDNMVQSFENPDILNESYEDRSRNRSQGHKTPYIMFSSKFHIRVKPKHDKSTTKTHFPLSRRFKNYLDSEETVGPGSYFKPIKNESPSFKFSSSPRMEDSISHRMAEFSKFLRSQTPSTTDHLERNIQFACANKQAMKNTIQNRAKINKEKVEQVLHQKQKITIDRLNSKREQIYQKFQRFEWRQRKEEFVQSFKRRTRKLFGAFFVIIKAVIRFKKMLVRARARFAMKKLAPLKILFRRKLEQIRAKHTNMIVYAFESMIYSSKTIMLFSTLKYRVFILQRNIRNFLACQTARREALKLLWQRRKNVLLQAFNIKPVSALKLHIKVDSVSIPDLITTRYIQEYMRVKFQEYIEKLDEYQMYCDKLAKLPDTDSEKDSKVTRSPPVYDIYTKADLLDSLLKEAYTRRISDKRKNTIAPVRAALNFLR